MSSSRVFSAARTQLARWPARAAQSVPAHTASGAGKVTREMSPEMSKYLATQARLFGEAVCDKLVLLGLGHEAEHG